MPPPADSADDGSLRGRVLGALPHAVLRVSHDGRIADADAEAVRLFGRETRDALVGCAFASLALLDANGRPCSSDDPISHALATGVRRRGAIGIEQPGAEPRWTTCDAIPDGRDVLVLLIEGERPERSARLAAVESRWQLLTAHFPDIILLVDRHRRIEFINRVLPGYQLDDVIGSDCFKYLEPGTEHEWLALFDRAIATRAPARGEIRAAGEYGKIIWYETIFVPVEAGGELVHVLVLSRDVTERRTMLAGLAERERLASIGMLAASVAHEIMNPLTYVLASLDIALSGRYDEDRKQQALIEARDGARRMQRIVWDLRTLGRTGGVELFYVDAKSTLETALRLCGPEVGRSANVVVDIDELPPVLASESRLCQVFINLLVNAAQAIERQPGSEGVIRICSRRDESPFVAIEVSDTGEGITAEQLGRIFDPFYTTKPAGTGLGLSISRDIIERMGGRIEVRSERGKGSTFTVWLSTMRPARPSERSLEAVTPDPDPS